MSSRLQSTSTPYPECSGRWRASPSHRLQRIGELNHHVRNALLVIAYHHLTERSEGAIQPVNAETVRIEAVYCGRFLPCLVTMRISPS